MDALNKKEVLAELEKLGIDTTSDLNTYFRQYKTYFKLQNKSEYILYKRMSRKNKKLLPQQK